MFLPANYTSFSGNIYLDEGAELILDTGDLVVETKQEQGQSQTGHSGGLHGGVRHPHFTPDQCK